MTWILNHFLISLCYGSLYLSVLLVWYSKKSFPPLWSIALASCLLFGLLTKQISFIAFIPIVLLAFASYFLGKSDSSFKIKIISGLSVAILGVGLETHYFPGFNNLKVLNQIYISQDAIPFTLYLNIDKTIVGLFILAFTLPLIQRKAGWIKVLKKTWPIALLTMGIILIPATYFQFVRFEPKFPESLWLWSFTNLLLVCTAEECFFRGFIQKYLCLILNKFKGGKTIGIILASLLFGLAHYPGGIQYMLLASVAGLGYGWAYQKTKAIEASILTHFSLNLVHFLFFTYPALASQ